MGSRVPRVHLDLGAGELRELPHVVPRESLLNSGRVNLPRALK